MLKSYSGRALCGRFNRYRPRIIKIWNLGQCREGWSRGVTSMKSKPSAYYRARAVSKRLNTEYIRVYKRIRGTMTRARDVEKLELVRVYEKLKRRSFRKGSLLPVTSYIHYLLVMSISLAFLTSKEACEVRTYTLS